MEDFMRHYTRALTIGGFDGSGGAGIQADLKVFSALRCYGMTTLTALPAQNTQGVRSITNIPIDSVVEQFNAIMEDIGADAIKLGMLHRDETIQAISECLENYSSIPMICDPVMVAKSGNTLLENSAIEALKQYILPKMNIITPNIPEAEVLLGNGGIYSHEDMEKAATDLLAFGPEMVVLKGGHLHHDDMAADVIVSREDPTQHHWVQSPRIITANTHGTGCTYSAAITAYVARGHTFLPAIRLAKEYLSQAIFHGAHIKCGKGHGPLHHFFHLWQTPFLQQI